jgi:hypothetical protein
MSTPCNSLNVQLIKVSDLATYSSIKDADQLMVIENTGGSKYSRKSTLSDLKDYANSDGISGYTTSLFNTTTDSNSISYYSSGNILSFSHGFSAVPSLVRVVLKCNSNDGRFVINQEVDVTSFFNNQTKPICSIVSSSSTVLLIVPTYTSITVYDYNSSTSVISQYNIDTTKWYLKIYAWK